MPKREPLFAWFHGIRVAELSSKRLGEVVCTYTPEALDTWPGNVPVLSCSLPLRARPFRAENFFAGVLPEGQHRQAMAAEAGVAANDTYALLARFGKDVAGAVVIAPEDPGERPGTVVPYTGVQLEEEVAELPNRPLGIHDDSELSIAGLQDKLLLVALENGGWGRPVHGYPSTHILKVEDRRFPRMTEFEDACLRLARQVGLTTVETVIEHIAGVPCLIVSRFDRTKEADGELVRIHQEDACQALDRDPQAARGHGKYEDSGGPALRELAGLLDRYAELPIEELVQLVRVVTFTVIIGNSDAHGKNLALVHPTPGRIRLAPLYDTVPTAMWSQLRSRAAMTVDRMQTMSQITLENIQAEANAWRLDARRALGAATSVVDEILAAAETLPLPEEVEDHVVARCKQLLGSK